MRVDCLVKLVERDALFADVIVTDDVNHIIGFVGSPSHQIFVEKNIYELLKGSRFLASALRTAR